MSVDTSNGHPKMDYKQHESSYAAFLALAKWTSILVIAILVGMAVFLV